MRPIETLLGFALHARAGETKGGKGHMGHSDLLHSRNESRQRRADETRKRPFFGIVVIEGLSAVDSYRCPRLA